MDRVPGQVLDDKGFTPNRAVDGRLALAAKVNLLSDLLSKHGITAPDEVTAPRRPTELMDLPNELLLRICRFVIYDIEKPKTVRMRALEVCGDHTYWMHEGILLVAYVARRLSANTRLRGIALDEMFANMAFRVSFGFNEPSMIRMAHKSISLPQWKKKGYISPMQNHLRPLMQQVTRLEIKLEPFESIRELKDDQAHLCLKGITAELSWIPTVLPNLKRIHVSIGRKSKTMFNYVLKGFLEDTIAAIRQWNSIDRRSIAHEAAVVQNRLLE